MATLVQDCIPVDDAGVRAAAQDLDELHAVDAGQHQVDQVEVEDERFGRCQQRIAVVEAADRDALMTKFKNDQSIFDPATKPSEAVTILTVLYGDMKGQ